MARAIARTIFSYVGWFQDQAAARSLPPLSPSAASANTDTGLSVGAVQRQPVINQDEVSPSNVVAQLSQPPIADLLNFRHCY